MKTEEEVVEFARRTLAEGGGLDAIFTAFEEAGLSMLPQIAALRSVTGLGLRDVQSLLAAHERGLSLAHVTQGAVGLLRSIPHYLGDGNYGHWIQMFFFDAVVGQSPWLTLVPGPRTTWQDQVLGSIHYWMREEPGETVGDPSHGALSGPGVDFDSFRAEMTRVVKQVAFFQQHATVVRDTPERATYRFSFDE